MPNQFAQTDVEQVTLYFDPACPWTWRTSRWLVDAAEAHDVPVEYAAFDLSDGEPIEDLPEEHRAGAAASRQFLRGVSAARERGHHGLIAAWYTAYGTELWETGTEPSTDVVRRTLAAAGGDDLLAALDDDSLDAAVAASRHEAVELAGDDAGSPVTVWELAGVRRGFFGPVIAPTPSGGGGAAIWNAIVSAATVPEFFELKARRTNSPTDH